MSPPSELQADATSRPGNAATIGVTDQRLEGGDVYARVATFQSDPANIDEAIRTVRSEVESGDTPPGLKGAKMLMLINRESGKGIGVTLFESEEAMRRGDEALNAMNPGGGERRTSVEFFEVPVQTVS
jgi:hypothetical protein